MKIDGFTHVIRNVHTCTKCGSQTPGVWSRSSGLCVGCWSKDPPEGEKYHTTAYTNGMIYAMGRPQYVGKLPELTPEYRASIQPEMGDLLEHLLKAKDDSGSF